MTDQLRDRIAAAPESLRWIVTDEHALAWESAANWLHANSHIDEAFDPQRASAPCDACWRAAAYATKGVVLAGYRRPDTGRSTSSCGCVTATHPGHYPSCPTRTVQES
ncbi:hypothetical protein OHV05_24600 [Kitasatospora sp. NBC_00070]|uniref:hypothetical protein n=1 Tax=Kitasatospora sp. NBC_00070 TaxID=2975962 RepID=UPI003246FCC0